MTLYPTAAPMRPDAEAMVDGAGGETRRQVTQADIDHGTPPLVAARLREVGMLPLRELVVLTDDERAEIAAATREWGRDWHVGIPLAPAPPPRCVAGILFAAALTLFVPLLAYWLVATWH